MRDLAFQYAAQHCTYCRTRLQSHHAFHILMCLLQTILGDCCDFIPVSSEDSHPCLVNREANNQTILRNKHFYCAKLALSPGANFKNACHRVFFISNIPILQISEERNNNYGRSICQNLADSLATH